MESKKKKNPMRRLKVLAGFFAVGFVGLAVGVLMISFSDLTGPIAEPPGSFEEAVEAMLDEEVENKDHLIASEEKEEEVNFDERIFEKLRPVRDVSLFPVEFQQTAEEWNAAIDEVTSGLLALVRQMPDMEYSEAVRKLWDLQTQSSVLSIKFGAKMSMGNEMFIDGGALGSWENTFLRPRRNWEKIFREAFIAVCVENEDWIEAGYRSNPYNSPSMWEREKSYHAKAGLAGKGVIAVRSVKRWFVSEVVLKMQERNSSPDPNAVRPESVRRESGQPQFYTTVTVEYEYR